MKVLAFIMLIMAQGQPRYVQQEVSGKEECAQFTRDFLMRADVSKMKGVVAYQVGCIVQEPPKMEDVTKDEK